MSNLENEFDHIAGEINNKIKDAAEALRQANEIAQKHGLKTIHIHSYSCMEDYGVNTDNNEESNLHRGVIDRIDFNPLLDEMDQAGWCSSSFDC